MQSTQAMAAAVDSESFKEYNWQNTYPFDPTG